MVDDLKYYRCASIQHDRNILNSTIFFKRMPEKYIKIQYETALLEHVLVFSCSDIKFHPTARPFIYDSPHTTCASNLVSVIGIEV